jgi:hypothetical protein
MNKLMEVCSSAVANTSSSPILLLVEEGIEGSRKRGLVKFPNYGISASPETCRFD